MDKKKFRLEAQISWFYTSLVVIYLLVSLCLISFKQVVQNIPQTIYLIAIVGLAFLYGITFLFMLFLYLCRKDLTYVMLLGLAFLSCDIYLVEVIYIVQGLINDHVSIEGRANDIAVFYYFRQLSFIALLCFAGISFKNRPSMIESKERSPCLILAAAGVMVLMALIAHNLSSYNPGLAITITTLKEDNKTLHWEKSYIYSLIFCWAAVLSYLTWKTRLSNSLWVSIALTCCSAILINILLIMLDQDNLYIWYISRGVETINTLCVISMLLYGFITLLKNKSESSVRDELTKLYNRKLFYIELNASLQKGDTCVLLLDIDKFKRINDTYGHQEGDRVIVAVVDIISKSIRDSDVFARIGGEEFAILLSCKTRDEAMMIAERIRKNVEVYTALPDFYHLQEKMTISIGVYVSMHKEDSSDKVVSCADAALYKAKNTGRNRVVYYGD